MTMSGDLVYCQTHHTKINSFCESCLDGICWRCFQNYHKGHKVHTLQDAFRKYQMNTETVKKRISNKFNSIIQALQKKERMILDMVGKSTSQQISMCESEIDFVNNLQNNMEDLKLEAYNIAYSGKTTSVMMYKKLLNGMNSFEEDKNRCFQQKVKMSESLCDYSLIHTEHLTNAIDKIDVQRGNKNIGESESSFRQKGAVNTEKENKSLVNLSRKRKLEEDDSAKDTLTSLRTKTAKLDVPESTGIGSLKNKSSYLQKVSSKIVNKQKNRYIDKKRHKSNEKLASKRTSNLWPRGQYVDHDSTQDKNTVNMLLQQQRSTVSYNDFDMFSNDFGNADLISMEKSFSFHSSKKREANFKSDSSGKSFKSISSSNKAENEKMKEKIDTSDDINGQKSENVNKQTISFESLLKRAEQNLKSREDNQESQEIYSVTKETRSAIPETTPSTLNNNSLRSSVSENNRNIENCVLKSSEQGEEQSKPIAINTQPWIKSEPEDTQPGIKPITEDTQPVIKSEPEDTGYEKAQLVVKSENIDAGYKDAEVVIKTESVDTEYEKQAHLGGIQVKLEPNDDNFVRLGNCPNPDGSGTEVQVENDNRSTLDENQELHNHETNNEGLDMDTGSANTDKDFKREKTSDSTVLTGEDTSGTIDPEIKNEIDEAMVKDNEVLDSNNNVKLYDLNLTVTINNDCQREISESDSSEKMKDRHDNSPICSGNGTKQLKKMENDDEPESEMKTSHEANSKSLETDNTEVEVIVIEDTDSDNSSVADSEVKKEIDVIMEENSDEVQDDTDGEVQDDIDDEVQDDTDNEVQDDNNRPIYDLNLTVTVNNDYQTDTADSWETVEGYKSSATQTNKTPTRSFGIQTETGKETEQNIKLTDRKEVKATDNKTVLPSLGTKDNPITCDTFCIKPIIWEANPIKAQVATGNNLQTKQPNTYCSFKSTKIGAAVFGGKTQSSGDKITSSETRKETQKQQINCVTPFQAICSTQGFGSSQPQTSNGTWQNVILAPQQQPAYTTRPQSMYTSTQPSISTTQPQMTYTTQPQMTCTTQPQSNYTNQLPPYTTERPIAYTFPMNYNTGTRPDYSLQPSTRYTSQQPYQFSAQSTTANFNFITPTVLPHHTPFPLNYTAGSYHVPTTDYRVGSVQQHPSHLNPVVEVNQDYNKAYQEQITAEGCNTKKLVQNDQQSKGQNHTETSQKNTLHDKKSLLEDYKKDRLPDLQLGDITNHVVEFSKDCEGSRFLQKGIQQATPGEISCILDEILTAEETSLLIKHMFGNQVIQCLISNGSCHQIQILIEQLQDQVVPLSLHIFGHKVIQMALITATQNLQLEILNELDGHVLRCAMDINGNHVIQTCIESVPSFHLQFILDACKDQVKTLSLHPYGYFVIQKILCHHGNQDVQLTAGSICERIIEHGKTLIHNQYGCHVLKSLIQHSVVPHDRNRLFSLVKDDLLRLSVHMFSGSVVEKCLTCLEPAQKAELIKDVCLMNEDDFSIMLTNKFSSSVVKTMLNVAKLHQNKVLIKKISTHLPILVDDRVWKDIVMRDSKS